MTCAVPAAFPVPVPGPVPVLVPVASTPTTLGASLLHDTCAVISAVLLSAYVPVAVNCCICPTLRVTGFGATAIETSGAAVTVMPACVPVTVTVVVSVAVRLCIPAVPKVALKLCTPASPATKG